MQIQAAQLKPLSGIDLSADERKILAWLKKAVWEPQPDMRDPTLKAKVPEFFSGVKLYNLQATGGASAAQGALALFIKKLAFQGVISKQELYPLIAQGNSRFIALKQTDLDNLSVGQDDEED